MTKKKKKGPNIPLSKERQLPDQSLPVPPSHEIQPPQAFPSTYWQCTKTLGKTFLKGVRGALEASAILGILAFYYQFSPNLSVTPHAGFVSDPFHTPFIISNNSYMNFINVRTSCLLFNVKFKSKGIITDTKFISDEGEAPLIAPGEALTVRCAQQGIGFGPIGDLLSADISIDVMFERFPYRHIRDEEKTFRFVVEKADESQWHWLPQPIGKP